MILVIYAHPYPRRSRASRHLAEAIHDLPGLAMHSLYERYPDFDIDIAAEQAALEQARLVVWLHPLYWYSVPGLMKHWFDKVLAFGWAYGPDGTALRGKHCLWVPTSGGDAQAYSESGMHEHPFADFVLPVEETARFCGMHWEPPQVVHGAHQISDAQLDSQAQALRRRLLDWLALHAADTPPGRPQQADTQGVAP
jgi:glutathione-regulated potassium-efflux system ancillary protein KefF